MMRALTYLPAVLSQCMLLAYLLGAAAHYGWYSTPAIFAVTLMPALLWFMVSWAIGAAQLLYGAVRWRRHPALGGVLTIAQSGLYILLLSHGWMVTA